MEAFELSKVYQLLEPGPVVWLTTSAHGRPNVMTMSWHMMMEFEPPLVGCVVSSGNHSFSALQENGECVLAIPDAEFAAKVVQVGNCSGRTIDKFAEFGLTSLPAQQVSAPLIAECFANLECRVVDSDWAGKYNLFVLEVVQAWIDPGQLSPKTLHHQGYGKFVIDGEKISLSSGMR